MDMKQSGLFQLGIIDSRSYDGGLWEIGVDLSLNSNFRVVDVIDEGE